MTTTLPFPARQPAGYEWLDGEPQFDPDDHLCLEPPATVTRLEKFGYVPADEGDLASPIAVSGPIRILSDEGAAVLLDIARRLRRFATGGGGRIDTLVRSGCYRSMWLPGPLHEPGRDGSCCAMYSKQKSYPTRCPCISGT